MEITFAILSMEIEGYMRVSILALFLWEFLKALFLTRIHIIHFQLKNEGKSEKFFKKLQILEIICQRTVWTRNFKLDMEEQLVKVNRWVKFQLISRAGNNYFDYLTCLGFGSKIKRDAIISVYPSEYQRIVVRTLNKI